MDIVCYSPHLYQSDNGVCRICREQEASGNHIEGSRIYTSIDSEKLRSVFGDD